MCGGGADEYFGACRAHLFFCLLKGVSDHVQGLHTLLVRHHSVTWRASVPNLLLPPLHFLFCSPLRLARLQIGRNLTIAFSLRLRDGWVHNDRFWGWHQGSYIGDNEVTRGRRLSGGGREFEKKG